MRFELIVEFQQKTVGTSLDFQWWLIADSPDEK
ncbi:hypothetical protein SAMN05444396_103105 [Flavobacterium segetis]|uniref:Uncharacterized protein n=1 Tax=Flavobacterium segetis TaxID=271157 RepID=A0A1M5FWV0_9FLAO|nr:hypothetical protein SAMN05444396_103105 [Flavobacterium segetis]